MMYQLLTGERPGFVNYFRKLLDLFYPRLCLACDAHLPPGKEIICLFILSLSWTFTRSCI